MNILTWNIEGISRNRFNLAKIIDDEAPSLIFIAEPWLHLADAPLTLKEFSHQYNHYLNSEDLHDNLLSLSKSRAHGGTLALWKKELDPYISIQDPVSSRILVLVLDKPGFQTSIHITIYLPTAGKDSDFIKELSTLQNITDNLNDAYPDSVTFIRGDANASSVPRDNNKRDALFKYFLEENKLLSIPINHSTYHHFMNGGMSDSTIDVILASEDTSEGIPSSAIETLVKVICSKTNSAVDSCHDILISELLLPTKAMLGPSPDNIVAPKVQHTKHRILWSEQGILDYQKLLAQSLPPLELNYCDVSDPEVATILFKVTNHILSEAAKQPNKSVVIGKGPKVKKPKTPSEILLAMKQKSVALKTLNNARTNHSSTAAEKENALKSYNEVKSCLQNLL